MGWVILIIIIFVLFRVFIVSSNAEKERIEQSRQKYERYLKRLKEDPGNADIRQKTLSCGREYSRILRKSMANSVFDEVALMNDINAACAVTQQVSTKPIQPDDIESRLIKLQDLNSKGLIDDADYRKRKEEIMSQI
ncbi:MAG: hypothetical protein JXR23_02270 [Pontiellaceae bacterium]|nr:hypothetical protein [Pontiellaceae bacterium]